MLTLLGEWRPSLLKTVSVLCNYATTVCEAVVVISQCNEILLKTALAFTNSVAFYLSTLLRLNAFLRLTLSGVRFSREDVDQRRHSCCPTWPPSRNSGEDVCSPLCWGGETSVERVKFVQSILPAVPTLYRNARSVCATILAVILVAPSVLCVSLRPSVSTVVMVCGGIRSVLFTLLTVTGYCTQLLDLPSL